MILAIIMVNQQLDPDCDLLKPGVLARESSKDSAVSSYGTLEKGGVHARISRREMESENLHVNFTLWYR